mgnify:CR=1 FL=1
MAIETQNGYPSIRITAGERVLRKAAELVPYEENPRRHGEKQMQALRRSLREFGFLRPLLIDRENRLVGQARPSSRPPWPRGWMWCHVS